LPRLTRMMDDAPDDRGDKLHGHQRQRDEQLRVGRDQRGPISNFNNKYTLSIMETL
jgi:hypothetical protein